MTKFPLEEDRPVTKSMKIWDQGRLGTGRGWSSSAGGRPCVGYRACGGSWLARLYCKGCTFGSKSDTRVMSWTQTSFKVLSPKIIRDRCLNASCYTKGNLGKGSKTERWRRRWREAVAQTVTSTERTAFLRTPRFGDAYDLLLEKTLRVTKKHMYFTCVKVIYWKGLNRLPCVEPGVPHKAGKWKRNVMGPRWKVLFKYLQKKGIWRFVSNTCLFCGHQKMFFFHF